MSTQATLRGACASRFIRMVMRLLTTILLCADINKMIALDPQTVATTANPGGCWDWWGSDDLNLPLTSGGQMVAIKAMIDRIVSGNATTPYTCAHWYDSNYMHVLYWRAYLAVLDRRMGSIRISTWDTSRWQRT